MIIELFADIASPWCYITHRRLSRALYQRSHYLVKRIWRPFQTTPDLPPGGTSWDAFARAKFGGTSRASAAFDYIVAIGRTEGIVFDFDRVTSVPNTFDAHRLIKLAARHGRETKMVDALFAAYFARGMNLNDRADLITIATEVGLVAEAVCLFLEGDSEGEEVLASQRDAAKLGIQAVPALLLNGHYLIQGVEEGIDLLKVVDSLYSQQLNEMKTELRPPSTPHYG